MVNDLDAGMRLACTLHDFAYWAGGAEELRRQADRQFCKNIWRWSLYRFVACWRWLGVRLFGGDWLRNPEFSWGYGWIDFKSRQESRYSLAAEKPRLRALLSQIVAAERELDQWKLLEALEQVKNYGRTSAF